MSSMNSPMARPPPLTPPAGGVLPPIDATACAEGIGDAPFDEDL